MIGAWRKFARVRQKPAYFSPSLILGARVSRFADCREGEKKDTWVIAVSQARAGAAPAPRITREERAASRSDERGRCNRGAKKARMELLLFRRFCLVGVLYIHNEDAQGNVCD